MDSATRRTALTIMRSRSEPGFLELSLGFVMYFLGMKDLEGWEDLQTFCHFHRGKVGGLYIAISISLLYLVLNTQILLSVISRNGAVWLLLAELPLMLALFAFSLLDLWEVTDEFHEHYYLHGFRRFHRVVGFISALLVANMLLWALALVVIMA